MSERSAFLKNTVKLLYPDRCPICDRILGGGGSYICRHCIAMLPVVGKNHCAKCGRPMDTNMRETGMLCRNCQEEHFRHRYTRGECSFLYEKLFRESVIRMKFQNRRDYLEFYAMAMAALHRDFLEEIAPALMLPIPMHKRKKRERGFDQCGLLVKKLSARTGIPCALDALERTRYTKPQKGLGREDRRKNLQGAFAVTGRGQELIRSIKCGPVLLVDDIYTTGATLDAAAGALKDAGVREIYFLALCIRA